MVGSTFTRKRGLVWWGCMGLCALFAFTHAAWTLGICVFEGPRPLGSEKRLRTASDRRSWWIRRRVSNCIEFAALLHLCPSSNY